MSTQSHDTDSLDFDFWKQLAKNDPEAFEVTRQKKIDALIEQAPAEQRRRLRGLQWQVDQARKLAGSPMASCLAISNMMWDSLHQLNQQQQKLTAARQNTPKHKHVCSDASTATVLAFPG